GRLASRTWPHCGAQALRLRQLATAGQRHHIKGSEKPVGLGSCRPLGNPPSPSNGERSPASLGRRAAGLSLDSKEKPRLRGTGPEFDWGETLEVSCLTHHPNPQPRIRFRRRTCRRGTEQLLQP